LPRQAGIARISLTQHFQRKCWGVPQLLEITKDLYVKKIDQSENLLYLLIYELLKGSRVYYIISFRVFLIFIFLCGTIKINDLPQLNLSAGKWPDAFGPFWA